jgi:Zn-dependent M28 family amino/carboxypeptidase
MRGRSRSEWAAAITVWTAACVVAVALTGAAPVPKKPNRPVAATSTAAPPDSVYTRDIVRWLADPAREGRGPGTAGLDSSAAYLSREMARLGLLPGGDSTSYLQTFDVTTGAEAIEPCGLVVRGTTFDLGSEFQPLGFSTNGRLRAPVVFAGYGMTAPGYDYDDYTGVDVHDKLVLVMTAEPGEMDSTSRFDGNVNTPHSELRTKAINAREHGALGMLVVNGPLEHAGEPLRKPRADGAGYMTSGLLTALISDAAAESLFARSGTSMTTLQRAIDSHTQPHSMALRDSATLTVTLRRQRAKIANVIGLMTGRDTSRALVVGAHYDHLGYGNESSLAPDSHAPHVGADDNASGVAAMLACARAVKRVGPPTHTIVFCAFTGEEMGLVGSGHFVEDPIRPLESVETMLNMDMVGRLRDNKLMVMGTGTAAEFRTLVANANQSAHFDLKTSDDGYGPSDHSSFYKKKTPVLMLFTGAHADYHKPSDTWDKINYGGLARVAGFATALVESLDARPRVTYTQAKSDSASAGRIAGGGGYGAYLGTIPDYMQTEGGVLLSGVRAGGPAEKAGMKGGDVIIKFDGVGIGNIYDYTFALRSRKPGQSVRITVKRDGKDVDLVATLGTRP